MIKKLLLLFFSIHAASTTLYGASSSQELLNNVQSAEKEDPVYLELDPVHFKEWPKIEIQKLHISEFSEKDYSFLKRIFPTITDTFEVFTQNHQEKDCFLFKSTVPNSDKEEKHIALAICKASLIQEDLLLTEVLWIAVDKELQGKKIGTAFMKHIGTNTGCDIISLDPAISATPFYIKLGFKELTSLGARKRYHNPYIKRVTQKDTL